MIATSFWSVNITEENGEESSVKIRIYYIPSPHRFRDLCVVEQRYESNSFLNTGCTPHSWLSEGASPKYTICDYSARYLYVWLFLEPVHKFSFIETGYLV